MSVAERVAEVHAAQRNLHMEPREDSHLTALYAHGELPTHMTAEVVARELLATDFVYKTTPYGDVIAEYMRCVADYLRTAYDLTWPATWQIVRFYAPLALKLMCVSASGGFVPEHYPHPAEAPVPK